MKKITDIIKNHSYLFVNMFGIFLTVTSLFSETMAFGGVFILLLAAFAFSERIILIFAAIVFIFLNLGAGACVENNKKAGAIILSLLFGSIGGCVAAHTTNKKFAGRKAMDLILILHIWLVLWIAVSYRLYSSGHYALAEYYL